MLGYLPSSLEMGLHILRLVVYLFNERLLQLMLRTIVFLILFNQVHNHVLLNLYPILKNEKLAFLGLSAQILIALNRGVLVF